MTTEKRIMWLKNLDDVIIIKFYVIGQGSVMCCNVLVEETVTRISTLSGRGKRGRLKDMQNAKTKKKLP